ncbi:NmrA domain-containing protein [Mycena indigotica]|uniref:NmrA domain-containing protein n=1 Tax=Mycena indigotica TaxID=2126181 RepID=A0A8H6T463_9AGAR|nr:NmrA domain-containing protein [Mycena indigotica]KAF7309911.1 NmrA domain-containing protein [Mycena indigotica]
MRDSGVEHVVFLSSYTIRSEGKVLRAITPDNNQWIPYAHAQVEINIEDIGFPYFTALRPAFFASNSFNHYFDSSVTPPRATIIFEDAIFDNIAPEDIGAVGGAVLVERPSDGKETIYLCGPELRTVKENWETIMAFTGRTDIDMTPISPAKFLQALDATGLPSSLANGLLGTLEEMRNGFQEPEYQIGVANVEKYTGRKATKFVDYLEAHKAQWQI